MLARYWQMLLKLQLEMRAERSHVMGGDNNHSTLKHNNWPGRVERCAEWATRRAVPKHASLSARIAGTYMADTSRGVTGCDTVQMVTKHTGS